jgi:hypothetical protein
VVTEMGGHGKAQISLSVVDAPKHSFRAQRALPPYSPPLVGSMWYYSASSTAETKPALTVAGVMRVTYDRGLCQKDQRTA